MYVNTPFRILVSSAAILVASGTASLAQERVGAVRGVVYDSLAGAPLEDAAVFLWDTPHRAVTDEAGRFVIGDVPRGDYTILFFHTRLGERGISPGPTPVTVAAADTVDVELATPSAFTMRISECLLEESAPGTGAVAGSIADGETGMGLPNAQVTLSWTVPGSREPERIHLEADGEGWYRTCRAPTGVPITATASFFDRQGLRRELVVPEDGSAELGFLLWQLEPSTVAGQVVDGASGERVADAEVWLRGTSFRAVTGPEGEFRLGAVPPGTYMMFMRHLRYGTRQNTLQVASGLDMSVDMHVDARAIEIAPITVTVGSRPEARGARGGITVTTEQIDRVRGRARDVADILVSNPVPGVIVRRRGDDSICIGYTSGQVRMLNNSTGGCVSMDVYINDVRANNSNLALQMPPESIERIEVYRPLEAGALFGAGSGNGVLVIYTRNR